MLVYHWNNSMAPIYVRSDYSKSGKRVEKLFDVQEASTVLDPNIKEHLLFIHAFSGCDTTSAVHDKGKNSVKKMIEKSKEAQALATVFARSEASQEKIYSVEVVFNWTLTSC